MSSGDGLEFRDLPLGANRADSIEITSIAAVRQWILRERLLYRDAHSRKTGRCEEYDREPTIWQSTQEARPHRVTADFIAELPFGTSKPFLNDGGIVAAIVSDWQVGGTFEWQPGQLLEWPANVFFYGDLDDIALDNPTLDRWFNTDAGFEKDPAKVPADFQKRAFPFRIDGVRAPSLEYI